MVVLTDADGDRSIENVRDSGLLLRPPCHPDLRSIEDVVVGWRLLPTVRAILAEKGILLEAPGAT